MSEKHTQRSADNPVRESKPSHGLENPRSFPGDREDAEGDSREVWDMAEWQTKMLGELATTTRCTDGALTCGFLKALPIPVPSRREYEEIAATFLAIEDKQNRAARKQSVLQDLFRTLFHELMTAKTRVASIYMISQLKV